MDKRSWPWKKKSSDKAGTEKAFSALESAGASVGYQGDQDKCKKPNYVQIPVESYSRLNGLEDQVKTYEDQVKDLEDQVKYLEDQVDELNDKLSEAHTEMTNKDNLVKQHAKVAEEAVSGWEKAEAEALALKNHLESVTLLKLTAEDRSSHLDGALKECMRQIRNLKEEHAERLHEVILTKTKQCDKINLDLESKIAILDRELLKSAAENAAISRSSQERSNMLIQISEEKSQAEADIELLKGNIESREREVNSLKYELHIVTKELEIRNEEKNMSTRSAEVANKQHLEGAKKIAKLEAECQRLRVLVRKKLPGPAALAQMKLEVENFGRDYGETRLRKSSLKPFSPHASQVPEFGFDNVQKMQKENEFLTERLFAMEEETKMLKEALAKRNSELQASRSICANAVSELQSLESHLQANNQRPTKCNVQVASSPPSLTSMSEDGNDDESSVAGSWATTMISEVSHFKKEKKVEKLNSVENAHHLELMDDFLEMEKLAYSSNDTNGGISHLDVSTHYRSENKDKSEEVATDPNFHTNLLHAKSDADSLPLTKFQSRISVLFESLPKDSDMETILDDMRRFVQETQDRIHQYSVACPEGAKVNAEKEICLSTGSEPNGETGQLVSDELADAISQIHDFVLVLEKEAMAVQFSSPDEDGFSQKIEVLSGTFDKVIHSQLSLLDFVLDLSHVLNKASELHFNVLGFKNNGAEANVSDCIDKVALPENKLVHDTSRKRYPIGCASFSDTISDPDIPHEGSFIHSFESNATSCKCSIEEFEQMKLEKENMVLDMTRCTENLEGAKTQLQEMEQLFAEAKLQLTSAQKLNDLAETQLKCMAESYKSLEARTEELQAEVNLLRAKTESLDNELKEERKNHQDALAKCKDLPQKLQRNESCAVADDVNSNQGKDLAAAAEKLAECQETIFLLGKKLNSFKSQGEFFPSPYHQKRTNGFTGGGEEELTTSEMDTQTCDQTEMALHRVGVESPMDLYSFPVSPEANILRSPSGSKHPKHHPTNSGSSSSSSPEKHARGFTRFFSSKGRDGY